MVELVKCRTCHRPITDSAHECRHCGTVTSYGRWKGAVHTPILWAFAAVFLIVVATWYWGPKLLQVL